MTSKPSNPFGSPAEEEEFVWDTESVGIVLPAGVYTAKLVDFAVQDNARGDGSNAVWTFEVITGEHTGKSLARFTPTAENSIVFLKRTAQALDLVDSAGKVRFKKADAIGRRCLITVEIGEYRGEKQAQIKTVAPLSDANDTPKARTKGVPA